MEVCYEKAAPSVSVNGFLFFFWKLPSKVWPQKWMVSRSHFTTLSLCWRADPSEDFLSFYCLYWKTGFKSRTKSVWRCVCSNSAEERTAESHSIWENLQEKKHRSSSPNLLQRPEGEKGFCLYGLKMFSAEVCRQTDTTLTSVSHTPEGGSIRISCFHQK